MSHLNDLAQLVDPDPPVTRDLLSRGLFVEHMHELTNSTSSLRIRLFKFVYEQIQLLILM